MWINNGEEVVVGWAKGHCKPAQIPFLLSLGLLSACYCAVLNHKASHRFFASTFCLGNRKHGATLLFYNYLDRYTYFLYRVDDCISSTSNRRGVASSRRIYGANQKSRVTLQNHEKET